MARTTPYRVVVDGWTVRFRRRAPLTGSFVSYNDTPHGHAWFKTRKEARAYVEESGRHKLFNGFAVRARLTFEADGGDPK